MTFKFQQTVRSWYSVQVTSVCTALWKIYLRSNLPNLFKIRQVLWKLWRNTFWCVFYAPQCTILLLINLITTVPHVHATQFISCQFSQLHTNIQQWPANTPSARTGILAVRVNFLTKNHRLKWRLLPRTICRHRHLHFHRLRSTVMTPLMPGSYGTRIINSFIH